MSGQGPGGGDPLAFLWRAGRVDRDNHGTGGRNAELRLHPLRPRLGEDTHPVAGADAEGDEPQAHLAGDVAQLGVGQILPDAVTLEALRGTFAKPFGAEEGKVCEGLHAVSQLSTP